MTKYLLPSAGVSAFLSSYFGVKYFTTKDKQLTSISEAVECLNENRRVEEAIDFILRTDCESSRPFLSSLSTRSVGALAGHGWSLVHSLPIEKFDVEEDDLCFEQLLEKFDLGEEFQAALDWLNRVPCNEEELGCTDAWFGRRPSQTARLHRILQVVFLKTEKPDPAHPIDEAVVQFLHGMYTNYKTENRAILLLTLKTLANVALLGEKYATKILRSEWLPLLTSLVVNGETLDERILAHKVFRNSMYTFGLADYYLPSDVYELHLCMGEPTIDVVLIHGLRGSVGYTWRQRDYFSNKTLTDCWPKDWLPHDIKDPIRILGIDYPSSILQFSGTMESLQVRADRFADQLEKAGVGRRPVVFICHSMGGLLAKKLVLDVLALRKRRQIEHNAVLHLRDLRTYTSIPLIAKWMWVCAHLQTVGILFIATPHKGSPLAESWSYEILSPSEDVRLLRQSNELNKQLDADFAKIDDSIPVISSMIETKESNIIGRAKGIVVPRESAVYSKGAIYHIDEIHHDLCKPSERTSPSYGVVLNFLRDSIFEAKKRANK